MKPQSLENLISLLNKFPGISKKQAEKLAYSIVTKSTDDALEVSKAINVAIKKIRRCTICNNLSENPTCDICNDKKRKSTLIIVESPLDVYKFEDTLDFKPSYHILGSLVNINKKTIDNLFIANLKERSKKYKEIIIALNSNLEGIVTANYVTSLLDSKKVTQLAKGIPLGAALGYVDELTLKEAISNRKKVK